MEEDRGSKETVEQKESEAARTPKEDSIQIPQLMEYPVAFWRELWKKIENMVEWNLEGLRTLIFRTRGEEHGHSFRT